MGATGTVIGHVHLHVGDLARAAGVVTGDPLGTHGGTQRGTHGGTHVRLRVAGRADAEEPR